MPPEKNERPFLICRKTRANRYTLPALLGCLEGEGLTKDFRVLIVNSIDELLQKAGAGNKVVCFSFMTPQLFQVKGEMERLRKGFGKEALFLAGGSHATGDPEGTLRLGFDLIFTGESERTFPGFLRGYIGGELLPSQIINGEKEPCHFFPSPPHFLEQRFFAPIELTRGCLYSCAFCQTPRIFGHPLRHRPARTLAGHLERSLPYGYRQSAFISSNAFSYGSEDNRHPNLTAIEGLLAICQQAGCEGIHFGCYPSEVRPDWVTPDVLHLVKRYCRNNTIVLGAQSGSNSLLARLNRGHTAEQALTASRWIWQAGFMPHVDFVFGFPEETMEDRRLSLSLMEKMIEDHGAKIHAHTFLPLPGTPLFQKEPSRLDDETKNSLMNWERKKKLDGWWKEQEVMGWKIVEWRDQGWIKATS